MVEALLAAATLLYVANLVLGLLVQRGTVSTRGVRWVHHVLFAAVAGSAAATVAAGLLTRTWWVLPLLPALVVWSLLPRTRGGTPRHRALALAVMPCHALAAVLAMH